MDSFNLTAIVKTNGESCADISYDGNPVTSEKDLNLIQIGWNIGGSFVEQIRICQDRRSYATLSTEHTMKGASIELRDTTPGRPSFRRDITGYTRFFREFRSQSQISS